MGTMSGADGPIYVHKFLLIPRIQNSEANDLAQMALGYKVVADRADLQVHLLEQGDWRAGIFNYLKDPARGGGHLRGYVTRP
jgi:hypothetical protein